MNEKRLLVIDTEPALAEVVRRVAAESGYDVVVTSHGKDFKKAFDRFNPTAVMLDIILPNIDGIELIDWLHDREYGSKVLVSTGSPVGQAKLNKKLDDVEDLDIQSISKPFRVATLRNALACPPGRERHS